MVTMLTFTISGYLKRPPANRRQAITALIIGIAATVIDAAAAAVAAFVGVLVGRWWPGG
jgi:hypothetical protein